MAVNFNGLTGGECARGAAFKIILADHAAIVLQDVARALPSSRRGQPLVLIGAAKIDPVIDEPEPLVWSPVRKVTNDPFNHITDDRRDIG